MGSQLFPFCLFQQPACPSFRAPGSRPASRHPIPPALQFHELLVCSKPRRLVPLRSSHAGFQAQTVPFLSCVLCAHDIYLALPLSPSVISIFIPIVSSRVLILFPPSVTSLRSISHPLLSVLHPPRSLFTASFVPPLPSFLIISPLSYRVFISIVSICLSHSLSPHPRLLRC
ncbi:hypothetical protein ASPSYDRAFT_1024593 [Aspergillus sydowii CBS 593.65]|uniref:Uncharacterized protein n=1 Tax=Aspergillus sydowii CBS 593.65 TaxID=1036612 RepID=A0A1L9TF37_9EURO|nr:uncharacterized protein ASPSYDRAFT_1024593 [Aspergillus sydowii CBS 593.65]OJJ58039.1 hypothetical protein ASPSYDRAFT_1024593 [Aspergillus sydowii CBS 593.65]